MSSSHTGDALQRRIRYLIGESYLRCGKLEAATAIFEDLEESLPQESLLQCADALVKNGDLRLAYDTYASVYGREQIPREKLASLAQSALSHGCFRFAQGLYGRIGSTVPFEAAATCANVALRNGHIDEATAAYQSHGLELPIDKVVAAADNALDNGSEGIAKTLLAFVAQSST